MAWPEDVLAAFRDLVASPAGESGLPGGSVADVATNIWRLRNRMSALPDGMRSTARHCEMAWDALAEAGGVLGDVSLSSVIGVPFVAAEPRITAVVFGLAGHETLTEAAARITVPVEVLLQWDDELVPREAGLALFDAFASREKTLHANPGGHADVPPFERESSERFLTRHLVEAGA